MSTEYPRSVQIKNYDGDIYEAVQTERDTPWDISWPEGGKSFYGSMAEVGAEIKRLIKDHLEAQA